MTDENGFFETGMTKADMDAFIDVVRTSRILMDYMNDETVHGISNIMTPMLKLVNAVSSTDLVDVLERSMQDPGLDKALLSPKKIGIYGLVKEMGNEDLQKGLGVAIELLKALGRAAAEQES